MSRDFCAYIIKTNTFVDYYISSECDFFRLNKLFGSNVHHDERGRVFNNQWKYDSNCDRDISQEIYCARCGRLLIPWDNNFGLCRHCSEETSRLFIEKCPWKIKESIRTHNSKDLFNLR